MRRLHRPLISGVLAGAALLLGAVTPASATTYSIGYSGSGSYHTAYHSNPPNPGGNPDTNDAHDSSTQRWTLSYDGGLFVRACRGKRQSASCIEIGGLTSAHGETSATGSIDHTHVDGLYPQDDASASCQLSAQTPAGERLSAALKIRYLARRRRVAITAYNPVMDVLTLLPQQCPSTPDGIDGLNDNYFMPGFSFAAGYGPARWFTSKTATVSLKRIRRSRSITIQLGLTAAGTPPAGCAVPEPSYERCSTGGAWSGKLTLTRRR